MLLVRLNRVARFSVLPGAPLTAIITQFLTTNLEIQLKRKGLIEFNQIRFEKIWWRIIILLFTSPYLTHIDSVCLRSWSYEPAVTFAGQRLINADYGDSTGSKIHLLIDFQMNRSANMEARKCIKKCIKESVTSEFWLHKMNTKTEPSKNSATWKYLEEKFNNHHNGHVDRLIEQSDTTK